MATIYNGTPHIELEFLTRKGLSFKLLDCNGYQSTRNLTSPTAQATATLMGTRLNKVDDRTLAGADIRDVIEDYDMCRVSMLDGKGQRWIDITGLVDTDVITLQESEGAPQHNIQLGLVGLGRYVERYQIFWHPHISGKSNVAGVGGYIRSRGKIPKGRPNEVVKQLIEAFLLSDEYALRTADGRLLKDAVTLRFDEFKDSASVTGLKALGLESQLWQMCRRYSDAPWGELFCDIERTKGRNLEIYLRPTPWGIKAWDALSGTSGWGYSWDDSERIFSESIDTSAERPYTMFWACGKAIMSGFDQLSTLFDQSGDKMPVYDLQAIQKYQLRQMIQPTEYVQFFAGKDEKAGILTPQEQQIYKTGLGRRSDLLYKRSLQLAQWFGYPKFLEGQVSLRGRIGHDPQHGCRIGSVITRKRDGAQFYVNSITQNWPGVPGPWTTTLGLTRGRLPYEYKAWWREFIRRHAAGQHKSINDLIENSDASIGGRVA